jgi:CDP-glycerol glycerophosphotransferase (TagB/SpsB family)
MDSDNGIYYFLGNITSHIIHALPLYQKLGGTFVVLSHDAAHRLEKYDVPVLVLNDRPHEWRRFGWHIKPVAEYTQIGPPLKKTVAYLNEHAKVVIFYELFEFAPSVQLSGPKKVFLTHGNMLKSYMSMYPKRLEIIKSYDHMAAIGPYLKRQFIEKDGIAPTKLVDLGIARTDQVVATAGKVEPPAGLLGQLGIDSSKPIFAYMPTFWGPSTIYNLGKQIVADFPDKYTLVFRPHPQTPRKILREYEHIISHKDNVIYAPEGRYDELGLLDLYRASSAIIGDVSSVMLEAVLLDKPLIFAYDDGMHGQDASTYSQIAAVADWSQHLAGDNIGQLESVLDKALASGASPTVWSETKSNIFFHTDGTSVRSIYEFVLSIA